MGVECWARIVQFHIGVRKKFVMIMHKVPCAMYTVSFAYISTVSFNFYLLFLCTFVLLSRQNGTTICFLDWLMWRPIFSVSQFLFTFSAPEFLNLDTICHYIFKDVHIFSWVFWYSNSQILLIFVKQKITDSCF